MQHLQSALGLVALLAFAFLISENRRAVNWKGTGAALAVTLIAAFLLLEVPQIKTAFALVNRAVQDNCRKSTQAGTSFVFGYLGGGALPFTVTTPGAEFVLAFQALPIVLVMSVLTTLLFYWRILPPVVRGFSYVLERKHGRRRRGGAVHRRQYFPRHGEIAAVHPAISRKTFARRTIYGDDRRHGRHRRHRVRALCDHPAQRHSRCRRPYFGGVHIGRAGRPPDQRADGAGAGE